MSFTVLRGVLGGMMVLASTTCCVPSTSTETPQVTARLSRVAVRESQVTERQPIGRAEPSEGRDTKGAAEPIAVREDPVPPPFRGALPNLSALGESPANEFANLSPQECRRRLQEAEVSVERFHGAAAGIAVPLRITGPIGGVEFRVPPARTPFGLLDCRLALVLARLTEVLVEHEVAAVRIDNFYRPRARLPGRRARSQHAHGLAADVVEFVLRDGRTLHVEKDWQGTRGAPPCGPEAALVEATDEALLLRNLVCAIAAKGYFHHILTPNYDAAHRDHLHLDIKRDAKWFGVH